MARTYDNSPPHIRKLQEKADRTVALHEDPGCDALSRSSIRELTDRAPEKWEREIDRMQAEDTSTYDVDGMVW